MQKVQAEGEWFLNEMWSWVVVSKLKMEEKGLQEMKVTFVGHF